MERAVQLMFLHRRREQTLRWSGFWMRSCKLSVQRFADVWILISVICLVLALREALAQALSP